MDYRKLLTEVEQEIKRLDKLRQVVSDLASTNGTLLALMDPGAPMRKKPGPKPGGKRKISPEGIQRMREAQQRRWAQKKKAAKSS